MYQLCNSVAFVHDPKVLHRELKLHILLKDHKTMVLNIADLSLSTPSGSWRSRPKCGDS
jgi:serine/threonine protein kinase